MADNVQSYVKMDFYYTVTYGFYPFQFKQTRGNGCGGVMISRNFMITADHCMASWRTIGARSGNFWYGPGFSRLITPYSTYENKGWASIPGVDLVVVRLNQNIDWTGFGTNMVAKLPAQCNNTTVKNNIGRGDVLAYRRMNGSSDLPRAQYYTSQVAIKSVGASPAANGVYYTASSVLNQGDSGGAWLSTNNELVGINNAVSGSNTYGTAMCMYSDAIRAKIRQMDPNAVLY